MSAPSNISVCAGTIIPISNFSSTPTGATYAWTNSNTSIGLSASGTGNVPAFTGTNITGSPISGIITVTPTLGGCAGLPVTYTITINPIPVVSITPSAPSIPSGGSGTVITASGATTYSWLPTAGLSSSSISNPTANPVATTTYTVTGTSGGCSSTATVTVTVVAPACFNTLNYDVPAGSNVSFFGVPSSLIGQTIRIAGVFTINTSYTFNGCNIIMMPGAKINVSSGSTLQLTNATHIFSCSDMWDGIYVLSGGILTSNANTMIEDGLSAINVASGGTANITGNIFNRNFTSIELTANAGATSPVTLSDNVFTCRNIPTFVNTVSNPSPFTVKSNIFIATPTYASVNLKVPYVSFKSNYGIKGADVKTLNIGSASLPYNGFDNLGSGIFLTNGASSTTSTTIIYNNKFQNMINGTACFPPPCAMLYGIGISASGTATGNNSITIGGIFAGQLNTFSDIYSAIEITNYKQATILKNTITNTSTIPPATLYGIGNGGIKVSPSASNTIEITQNSVTNCLTGIWMNRSLNGINALQAYIDGNTITANASGRCTNAINISDVTNTGSTTPIDKIKVRNNIITNVYNCVTATNVKHGLIIYQNPTLSMRNNGTAVNGIRLNNCLDARVHDNPNITISPTVSPVTSTSITYKGIVVTTSLNSWISCNKIFSMGESMVFSGLSTWSSIFNNQLSDGNRGFVLRTNGEVGAQGSSSLPCGLWWGASFTAHTFVEGTSNANTNSKLYYNSTGAPVGHTGTPSSNAAGVGGTAYSVGLGGLNTASGSPLSCSISVFMAQNTDDTKSYIEDDLTALATDDNFYPVYEPETQYHSKTVAFQEIYNDNGASIVGDSLLQNFYDSTQLAPLGQLKAVDQAMIDNNYVSAYGLNNSINSPANISEENQKQFNNIFLLAMTDSTYQYTQVDIDKLYSIAEQCPFEGGTAVWQARVLYCSIINSVIEFEDNCDPEVRMQPSNTSNSEGLSFRVHPNPNTGNMTLEYHIPVDSKGAMHIYDLTGRLLKEYSLSNKSSAINLSDTELSAGQYYYSIYVNGILSGTKKLTIVK